MTNDGSTRHDDATTNDSDRRRGWVWSADAMSAIDLLRAKAHFISMRENRRATASTTADGSGGGDGVTWSPAEIDAIRQRIDGMLDRAEDAAQGRSPRYRPGFGWWSGACAESAFRNVHNAEALLARLYTVSEVKVEALEAARRVREALDVNNPTYVAALSLIGRHKLAPPVERSTDVSTDPARQPPDGRVVACTSEALSEIIQVGHDAADKQRAKLRTFRNVLLLGSLIASALALGLVLFGAAEPSLIPLCFEPSPPSPPVVCPSGDGMSTGGGHELASSGWDVFLVALMGLLGGALSAAVFIRGLYLNNSTPYNVAVPLALSKLPAGAMTSVLGMILLAGDFVPGFTAVDKQGQVLAYAVLFGFAQQLFTQLLDRRAEQLIASVPTKAKSEGKIEARSDGVEFAFIEYGAGPGSG